MLYQKKFSQITALEGQLENYMLENKQNKKIDIFSSRTRIFLYEIECETPNHIYVGITYQIGHRFTQHQKGRGAKFTKEHGVKRLKIITEYNNMKEAYIAETDHVLLLRKLFPNKVVSKGHIHI